MSQLTADTITDDDIRRLLSVAQSKGHSVTAYTCRTALGEFRGGRMGSSTSEERQAKAQCAEILNTRSK